MFWFKFVYRAYSERLTEDDLNALKLQFDRLDVDHDGLISNADLVDALSLEPAMASKMIVHLNKGRKDAEEISFDWFLESRMKYDLSQHAACIFHEIMGGNRSCDSLTKTPSCDSDVPDSVLAGFDSCESASNGSLTPPVQSAAKSNAKSVFPATVSTAECLSQSAVIDFAVSQFPFKIEVCDSTLDKVFHRFGANEGLLSSKEFICSMKVRPIGDALGLAVE